MKPTARFSDKVILNTFFNTVGRGWQVILALLLTPYIVSSLGVEQYGIWALFGVLIGYVGLLDMGISGSFVRYIADAVAQKDDDKFSSIVNTGLFFSVVFSLAGVAVVSVFSGPILGFLGVSPGNFNSAQRALAVAMAGWAVSNSLCVFSSVQGGLQRMDLQNALGIVQSLLFAVLAVLALKLHKGLVGLVWASAIPMMIISAVNIFIAARLWPALRFGARFVRRKMLITLFRFGYQMKIAVFADLISFQTDKILLGHFVGMASVTDYQLGANLASMIRSYPGLVVSAAIPAATELHVRGEKSAVLEMYQRSYKYVAMAAFPVAALLIVGGHDLMRAWMNKGFPNAVLALRILAVGYLANVMGAAAASIGVAIERPDIQKRAAVLMAAMNLVLSVVLVIKFGFIGVLFGTGASLIAAHVYHLTMLNACIGASVTDLWKKSLSVPFFAGVSGGIAAYAAGQALLLAVLPDSRMTAFAFFAVKGLCLGGVYTAGIFAGTYLDKADLDLLGRVPVLGGVLRLRL